MTADSADFRGKVVAFWLRRARIVQGRESVRDIIMPDGVAVLAREYERTEEREAREYLVGGAREALRIKVGRYQRLRERLEQARSRGEVERIMRDMERLDEEAADIELFIESVVATSTAGAFSEDLHKIIEDDP